MPEAWLRGPLPGVPDELMPAAHSFVDAVEELTAAASDLAPDLQWIEPFGRASVGFHLRHVAGSTDRLLTYAANRPLSAYQLSALREEANPGSPPVPVAALLGGLEATLDVVLLAFRSTDPATLSEPRHVGRDKLPSSVRGLFFHLAEHARRHAGQTVVTAQVVQSLPTGLRSPGAVTLADMHRHWVENATRAYEEAGMQGLCGEGRFEYALLHSDHPTQLKTG